jgi:hypothetical protein
MKTKIVTAIYSNLHNTKFGGRDSRGYHYIMSLKTILNIANADFVLYTSEEEYDHLYLMFKDYRNLIVKKYNLNCHNWKILFDKYKNYEEAKKSDRCLELQYSKIFWLNAELSSDYDRIYWFDAGLSYTGLIPDKYMLCNGNYINGYDYYNSTLFNNNLLKKLNEKTNNKLYVIKKENHNNFWAHQPLSCFDVLYDNKWHIIGGLFGGDTKLIPNLYDKFNNIIECCVENYNEIVWHEENILTVIYYGHNNLFTDDYFDVWWHENNCQPMIEEKNIVKFFHEKKSFYKILENLQ